MKLLLAIDGSDCSQVPVEAVATRPWPAGTRVRVLTVVESPRPPPNAFWPEAYILPEPVFQQVQESANALVSRVAARLGRAGLEVDTRIRQGDPRAGIVDEAVEWGADLILVGSHGYTGFKRLLMGSVAQFVVGHAPCSVEVVRSRAAHR